ncbi:NADH-quinone oxidoreductase subunit K [Cellulomonas fimi]|uniref:NADH-quinone oxidoreductase subunit K n=1 Tax=Cellulomonas fimi TaxID=1708 RepID=A0A7Y0QGD6_CELFI|nr:NADH-quinone oxidoreductase subunit K [Cellulomonas fimi]
MVLQLLLTVAAALIGVGVFGALSQQSIVMVMMGIELIVNGVLVAAASAWFFLAPERPDGQVLVVVALVVMAVEMVMGFAATIAIYRARKVDMVDMATELRG